MKCLRCRITIPTDWENLAALCGDCAEIPDENKPERFTSRTLYPIMKTLLVLSLPAKPQADGRTQPCKEQWDLMCNTVKAEYLALGFVDPTRAAPISYTSEEIELWQALAAAGREMAAQVFTERTGKPHDPAFLL